MSVFDQLTDQLQAMRDLPVAIYTSRDLYRRVLLASECRPVDGARLPRIAGAEFREDPVLTESASPVAELMVIFDDQGAWTEWHEASREKKGRMLFGMGPMVMEPIIGRPGQGWEGSTKTLDPRPEGMRVFFVTNAEDSPTPTTD